MPDPIDDLESFTMPTATPLPPQEVRRRGDRIRRRNNALATVGGVAVVAAIVAPIAVIAGGGASHSDQPIAPATRPAQGWTTAIPPAFDLGALPAGSAFTFDVSDSSVVDDFRICGVRAYSTRGTPGVAPATDVQGATTGAEAGTDGGTGRTFAVYRDGDTAQAALTGLRNAVEDCPEQEQPGNGLPLVNDVVDVAVPGADDALVYTNQATDGETLSDLTVVEVVRVGNALYLADAHTAVGGEQAMGTVDNLIANSAPVVGQMCTFSVDGCGSSAEPSVSVDEPSGLAGPVPDGFPLEKGLPTDPQGGVGLEGPSHDLDLAVYNVDNSLRACGVAPTGLPKPVDTLYAGYRSPAEGVLRQLMTFESTDAAQAYAEGLLAPFAACPEDDLGGGATKVYEVTPEDLGDYAASSVMRVEVDGEPGVGYQVVQVVRVGQAVLQTLVNNDGEQLDGKHTPDEVRTMYLENSQSVVDEMS